jgi:hypothetical protein
MRLFEQEFGIELFAAAGKAEGHIDTLEDV